MTDFENSIKREMTKDKYEKIRDHVYSDKEDFKHFSYGKVASWFTWNRKKNGQIANVHPPIPDLTQKGHYYDGPISQWDGDKLPAEHRFSSRITTRIVFLGLNMSGEGEPGKLPIFQNARGHKRVVRTFFGTKAEGGYFTDIIKPDQRILDNVENPSEAEQVTAYLNRNPKVLNDHIQIFTDELKFIEAENPLLIVFGKHAEWAVTTALDMDSLNKRKFHAIVYTMHYAAYPQGGDEGYMGIVRKDLARYITIPAFDNNFPDNMGR